MRVSAHLLTIVSAVAAVLAARPAPLGDHHLRLRGHPPPAELSVADAGHITIRGAPTANSQPPPVRHEINDLKEKFPDQWNLYLLGLLEFQAMDESLPDSYYQVAGIHGRPYIEWQGATGVPGQWGGYCPHASPLFFGWHRSYVALYEQLLCGHVQAIAAQYAPGLRDRYVQAASDFRVPYWDWALNGVYPPDFLISDWVADVVFPNGSQLTIPNPLHHFHFHPVPDGDFQGDWTTINRTLRWPDSHNASADSRNDLMVQAFQSANMQLHEFVSQAMAATDFNDLSLNHIEPVHGNVHYWVGGSQPDNPVDGHMWPLDYAAFDPIFMLHHCNVDRFFALWQTANPDKFMTPASSGSMGTFAIPDNIDLTEDTPLAPFWNGPSTFWTTRQLRYTETLGYAYPESQRGNLTDAELMAQARTAIVKLYSPFARGALSPRLVVKRQDVQTDLSFLSRNGTYTDWTIRASAVGCFAFNMRVSLRNPVATWSVLISGDMGSTAATRSTVSAVIPLTSVLLGEIQCKELASLNPEDVVPYLKQYLSWEVYNENGLVATEEVSALSVRVASASVTIPPDPDQPLVYSSDVTTYPDATASECGATA